MKQYPQLIDKKVKFPKGNEIDFFQDFNFLSGIPFNIEFTIESKTSSKNKYWLIGKGYGQKGFYGNGRICVDYKDIITIISKEMKITKDTKIGDLIPEDHEFDYCNGEPNGSDDKSQIHIHIKKKEIKNFDWYVDKYIELKKGLYSEYVPLVLRENIKTQRWDLISFEIKIGLLKLICDGLKYSLWFHDLIEISKRLDGQKPEDLPIINEIFNICPKEFLISIFK